MLDPPKTEWGDVNLADHPSMFSAVKQFAQTCNPPLKVFGTMEQLRKAWAIWQELYDGDHDVWRPPNAARWLTIVDPERYTEWDGPEAERHEGLCHLISEGAGL